MPRLYRIYEDLIDPKLCDQIEMVIFGFQFPWNFHANTNYSTGETQPDDVPQFTHGFYRDDQIASQVMGIPMEIIKPFGLELKDLYRAKANMVGWEKSPKTHPPHTDDDFDHYVILYYVNDSDGETELYIPGEETVRITPRKGRTLVFDGKLKHASASPVETRYRAAININVKAHVPRAQVGLD